MCVLGGTQEPWEGVFGHQSVDPPLRSVEGVGARRVHHTQQSLPGFSIQVYLTEASPHYCCQAFFNLFLPLHQPPVGRQR